MAHLSFLMPAKDVAPYIREMLRSLQSQAFRDWELVVVDDHSTDGTLTLLENEAAGDPRIRVLRSPGQGQVQALNHGFAACSGRWLKVVAGDDFLPGSFSEHLDRLEAEEATYHDGYLLRAGKSRLRPFRVGPRFAALDLAESLRRIMISPPRWSWTISRTVAERIFPLPADLPSPHEDVYLGLKIKQSSRIIHVPRPLYVYRERPGQFYGGLFNFSPGVVVWRAKAMLRVIALVKAAGVAGAGEGVEDLLAPAELYYQLLAEDRVPVKKILRAGLTAGDKFRVVLIRKAPALASSLSRWRARRRRA
jgi:glycosyltransferase involved in cell wall biosynthesis